MTPSFFFQLFRDSSCTVSGNEVSFPSDNRRRSQAVDQIGNKNRIKDTSVNLKDESVFTDETNASFIAFFITTDLDFIH